MPESLPNEPQEAPEPKIGDLVYITPPGHEWLTRASRFPGINLSGRLARIIDIYDWGTEKGKTILTGREATGKWSSLKSEDFKYVLLVFYPDLSRDGKQGVMHPELLPLYHPRAAGPKVPLFCSMPQHLQDYMTGAKELELVNHNASN